MKLLPWVENPYKLWSILDMLKVSAKEYIEIGQLFGEVKARMAVLEAFGDRSKRVLITVAMSKKLLAA